MSKILIIVSTWNRKTITELTLEHLNKIKGNNSIIIYDDHSTEYSVNFLKPFADEVIKGKGKIGIQWLRAKNFRDFASQWKEYDYLYITDNDALQDPNFSEVLMSTYNKWMLPDGRKMPISLYNTIYHMQPGNTLKEVGDVILRKTAPGVSQFFDRDMVNIIVDNMNKNPKIEGQYGWDYHLVTSLNRPWIQTKTSYCEHYGADGIHSVAGISGMDRDKAINPTEWLAINRQSIIDYVLFDKEKPLL